MAERPVGGFLELTIRDVACYLIPGAALLVVCFGMPFPGSHPVEYPWAAHSLVTPEWWTWLTGANIWVCVFVELTLAYVAGHFFHNVAEILYYLVLKRGFRFTPQKLVSPGSANPRWNTLWACIGTSFSFSEVFWRALIRQLRQRLPYPPMAHLDVSETWNFCFNTLELKGTAGLPFTLVRVKLMMFIYRDWSLTAALVALLFWRAGCGGLLCLSLLGSLLFLRGYVHYSMTYVKEVFRYWYALSASDEA